MPKPPPLTKEQLSKLAKLEPALRDAVRAHNCDEAKRLTSEIHHLLKPTGHHTRLLKAKLWYFECVMETRDLEKARRGFTQIRERLREQGSENTRIFLEATALVAICYLRLGNLDKAKLFIITVLTDVRVISSQSRRFEFRKRMIERFDEEGLLAASKQAGSRSWSIEEIADEAASLADRHNEPELMRHLGDSVPGEAVIYLLKIDRFAKTQLTVREVKLLPSPEAFARPEQVGRTFFGSLKRVIWRALCDPKSRDYQDWIHKGLKAATNKTVITTSLATALTGNGFAIKAVIVSVVAVVFKLGIGVYCDRFEPNGVMIDNR